MKILISNDDGVHAEGIAILAKALSTIAEITVVAPERNCSAASNSLTIENPLRAHKLPNGFYSINGTPTDCVHLALNKLIEKPDLVVSGINAGANLGDDVIYSGTVAAAMEGRFMGLPAIAISSCAREPQHFDSAAQVALCVIKELQKNPLPANQILNINVPDLPFEQIKGLKTCRLGSRHRADNMVTLQDPSGRKVFWVGPPGEKADAGEGTDFHAIDNDYATITPIKVDLTAHKELEAVSHWASNISFLSSN